MGLLVDGESFRPNSDSPSLLDAVPWLAEALLLGHEFGADGFERNVNITHIQERLRKLRLREANTITLMSQTGSSKAMDRYLHRDDSRPTLLVNGVFDSHQLVESAKLISAYLHSNLHSFEMLLVRLVLYLGHDQDLHVLVPSEGQYAAAAQAPIEAVRDYLAAFRHDDASRVDVLIPLVAYFSDADLARDVGARLLGERMSKWQSILGAAIPTEIAERLLAETEKTLDLFTLMRELGLEYPRFNRCLLEVGRLSLVSEPDLRRQFEVWKNDLRPQLLDRLRHHFQDKFDDPTSFAPYAGMRDLEFITYDAAWTESRQTIERWDVLDRANEALAGISSLKGDNKLPAVDALRLANRKVVTQVSEVARRVLEAAGVEQLHEMWSGGPGEVAADLDRAGLLDFHFVGEAEALQLLVRSGFWPEGVPQSLNPSDHGLTEEDMDRERQRAQQQLAEERRRRNLVVFGDIEFDTSDAEFSRRFAEAASQAIATGGWESRSSRRLAVLVTQPEKGTTGKGGGGRGVARPPPRPPESIRGAIGLAGELIAFQYLAAKHPRNFNDNCWVSENRRSMFPEDGDLTLGYDFRVATTEREWLYEVKATPGDLCEFELTDNEYRQAVSASPDRSRRYRILFVFHALDPSRCRIIELPNPASDAGDSLFRIIGRSSTRMRFELKH